MRKLLDALRGYQLSFYHLNDHRLDTYIISDRTRAALSRLLLSPQGDHRILFGSFDELEIGNAIKDTLIHHSRELDEKYAKLMKKWETLNSKSNLLLLEDGIDRSFNGFIKNPELNCMISIGSRRYKDVFPKSKKKRGRPRKLLWGG